MQGLSQIALSPEVIPERIPLPKVRSLAPRVLPWFAGLFLFGVPPSGLAPPSFSGLFQDGCPVKYWWHLTDWQAAWSAIRTITSDYPQAACGKAKMACWIVAVLVRLWHWWHRYVFGF